MSEVTTSRKSLIVRFSIFGAVLILIIGSVSFFSSRLNTPANYSGGKVVGKIVPDVTLVALDGEEVALRELSGKRVIVNFFNSWCIPCQEELPDLQEFARKYQSDPDFVFIGIVRDDSEQNIRSWVDANEVPFDVVFDPGRDASIGFGTTGQPETYAIAPDGRVVASILSRASLQSLEELWQATG